MSLIRQVGKAVFAAADLLLPSPPGPRVLIYHQVGAGLGRQMEVTTEDFVWQLDWLAQNRQVVSLEEALERWEEDGSEKLVVLTFDDGYRDTYTAAFPLMKERGMPFTLYLATKAIESGDLPSGAAPLTWDQIGEMIDTGLVTVGAHTHTHADLRNLARGEVTREVEICNHLIAIRLGSLPRHFAYPWGYWSATADPIVRAIYLSAALGAPNVRFARGNDPYLVNRFPIQLDDGSRWFFRRLTTGLISEEVVRRAFRGYRGP
jgi:peptidoglycan/xylan/chitin deacetylase (PgdA/CDA1 family)